jgi:hypothetical protein
VQLHLFATEQFRSQRWLVTGENSCRLALAWTRPQMKQSTENFLGVYPHDEYSPRLPKAVMTTSTKGSLMMSKPPFMETGSFA